mmetsp:Transcript_48162/g.112652  ORF Transcript_48162/g.112652 Transcript_48162/m.112652 type:complete len:582 (-) Transcript_48162:46-1791(-)
MTPHYPPAQEQRGRPSRRASDNASPASLPMHLSLPRLDPNSPQGVSNPAAIGGQRTTASAALPTVRQAANSEQQSRSEGTQTLQRAATSPAARQPNPAARKADVQVAAALESKTISGSRKTPADYRRESEASRQMSPGARERAQSRNEELREKVERRKAANIEDQKIKVWQLSQRMQKCGKASLKRKFDQNPLDTTLKVEQQTVEQRPLQGAKGGPSGDHDEDFDKGAGIAYDDMKLVLDMVLPGKAVPPPFATMLPQPAASRRSEVVHDEVMQRTLAAHPTKLTKAFVVTGELDETIPSRALADDDALDREAAEAQKNMLAEMRVQEDAALVRRILADTLRTRSDEAFKNLQAQSDAGIVNWLVERADGLERMKMAEDLEALHRTSAAVSVEIQRGREQQTERDVAAMQRLLSMSMLQESLEEYANSEALWNLAPALSAHRYLGPPTVDAMSDAALIAALCCARGPDEEVQDVELLHQLLHTSKSEEDEDEQRNRDVQLLHQLTLWSTTNAAESESLNSARAREDDDLLCELAGLPLPIRLHEGTGYTERRRQSQSYHANSSVAQSDHDAALLRQLLVAP